MKHRAFTVVELLVVVGIIVLLAALLLPGIMAQLEGARINEMKGQLKILEAALEQYHRAFDDYPPSWGTADNAPNETLLQCLRTHRNGGPFLRESAIARWLWDTDGDGRQELVDPWKNPWVYFHHLDYARGGMYYIIKGRRVEVQPARKGDVFENPTSYQLWACGPNKTDESGHGDDAGNVGR